MIEKAIQLLRSADDPALWLSGGADSRLLLELLIREDIPFVSLRFDDGWSREQSAVVDDLILKHGLRVYSYPMSGFDLVGDGRQLSMISSYAVGMGGEFAILVRDLAEGERCYLDVPKTLSPSPYPPILFKTHIWGSKRSDRHFAVPEIGRGAEWRIGKARFIAPLYEWSDADVRRELKNLGVEYREPTDQENTGNLVCCHKCLCADGPVFCPKAKKEIPSVEWSPTERLAAFQQRHNSAVRV